MLRRERWEGEEERWARGEQEEQLLMIKFQGKAFRIFTVSYHILCTYSFRKQQIVRMISN